MISTVLKCRDVTKWYDFCELFLAFSRNVLPVLVFTGYAPDASAPVVVKYVSLLKKVHLDQ